MSMLASSLRPVFVAVPEGPPIGLLTPLLGARSIPISLGGKEHPEENWRCDVDWRSI
jgi:hypothetical protein